MAELSVVGKSLPRVDAAAKVTGAARYAADLQLPGMLYGKILRSPLPHARILHIDADRARRHPGVRAILTGAHVPQQKRGLIVQDETVLAIDRARFVGDEVAAVAAIDPEIAEEALELIRVDYERLPAVYDPLEAIEPGAPKIHDVERNVAVRYEIVRGDAEEGFRAAAEVVEERFITSAVHPCYLEPNAGVASFDASGRLTLWTPDQMPYLARWDLAKLLGLGESQVRIIQTCVGGGFGGKHSGQKVYPIAALLAREAGRPVQVVNSRAEELRCGLPRVPMVIDLKLGLRKDGTLLAKQARIVADNGAYSSFAPAVTVTAAYRPDSLYRYRQVKTEALLVYTNKAPTGAFRGLGNPQMTFAVESLLDRAAERIGMDPAELRLKNAVQTGDTTLHGWIIRSCGLSDCIRQATRVAGWPEKRRGARGRKPGVGPSPGEAVSRLRGVGLGSFASRLTTVGGNAVKAAAADAKRQLFELAAQRLDVEVGRLEARGGKIAVSGMPERSLTVAETAQAALFRQGGGPIIGVGSFDSHSEMADPRTRYGNISTTYSFAAQVAEVEVDPETGGVEVVRFVAAHDLGRAINPAAAEGQVEGGIAQGIGYALTEELRWEGGTLANPTLAGYRLPTALDVPSVETLLVESIDPIGPFGAKGIGESALVPTAAAIANAVYHATGIRVTRLPIDPEWLRRRLREARGALESF